MSVQNLTLLDRLVLNAKKIGKCIEWQRSIHSAGYGQIWHIARNLSTHRVAYELFIGPIPDGLLVLHKCDNRLCVRPEHLFLGTNLDNAKDRMKKGRQATGQGNGKARMTKTAIREVRQRCACGETQAVVAAEFGIGIRHVQDLVAKRKRASVI